MAARPARAACALAAAGALLLCGSRRDAFLSAPGRQGVLQAERSAGLGASSPGRPWRRPRTALRAAGEGAPGQGRSLLLLYPDTGAPSFAEVPHMGTLDGASGSPGWAEAAAQLARRVVWDLDGPHVEVKTSSLADFEREPSDHDFVFGVDLGRAASSDAMERLKAVPSRLFISSSPDGTVPPAWRELTSLSGVGAEQLEDTGPFGLFAALGGWADQAKLVGDVTELWQRKTAEEAIYATLVLIDGLIEKLPSMQQQKPVPTTESITRAVEGCQDEFRQCFTQPRCLQSLACLSQCGLADQSCSYRCIVSYQSEAFTQFSLCALQKQNLLNSQVVRPDTPQAEPMPTFRGQPLTHEVAEQILVGHFNPAAGQRHSWLVAAGSNPAYEQFALQYQLWYKGDSAKAFWYHPTFLVEALDGQKIWRNRDYRVRRKKEPGMWEFSVLDNGITSEEKWHLLGTDDDLNWLVLFYVGAARKAGLTYRGCLVLTPNGEMPSAEHMPAVEAAVARAGMKLWELEATSNPPVDPANPPPLIAPETQPAAPLLAVTA